MAHSIETRPGVSRAWAALPSIAVRALLVIGVFGAVVQIPAITQAATPTPTPAVTPDPSAKAHALCTRADAYEAAGFTAQARSAYADAIKAYPQIASTPMAKPKGTPKSTTPDECPLVKAHRDSGLKRASDAISDAAPKVALIALVGVMAVFLAVVVLGWVLASDRFGWTRCISRFFSRVPGLRPRVSFAAFNDDALGEDHAGAAMTARIRERLQRVREEASASDVDPYRLDFGGTDARLIEDISGNSGVSAALGKLGEASDPTKILSAVADVLVWLLPVVRLTVEGTLEPIQRDQARATMTVQRDGKLVGAISLANPPILPGGPKAGDYLDLSEEAAVWLQFQMAKQLAGNATIGDPQSYALVRKGLDLLRPRIDGVSPNPGAALQAFDDAIALNPKNWSAHLNRFVVQASAGATQTDYAGLLAEIQQTLADIKAERP